VDLIISSESGPAKGIVPPASAVHVCYCHSPMRYIWNMSHDYLERADFFDEDFHAHTGTLYADLGTP
jgi:hypothetical protein